MEKAFLYIRVMRTVFFNHFLNYLFKYCSLTVQKIVRQTQERLLKNSEMLFKACVLVHFYLKAQILIAKIALY